MTQHPPDSVPTPMRPTRTILRAVLGVLTAACAVALVWRLVGASFWNDYQKFKSEQRAAEDSVPIGYVGINYRRSYNDQPPRALSKEGERTLLWAAKGEPGEPPVYHDITGADFDPRTLSGGFGRDSIPGIDYPIFDSPGSPRGKNLRDRQSVFGLSLGDGPRAYPKSLLEKIEVVNDRDGQTPLVVVYDRKRQATTVYRRVIDGRELTFGTTGYAVDLKPLLYDRSSKSLWLPTADSFACVSGERKGTKLPLDRTAEPTTWGDWSARYPSTVILMGNDRSKPIPAE